MFRVSRFPVVWTAALVLASCAVGPDYDPPQKELEASFKQAGFTAPPPQGSWWKLYRDPQLDALITAANVKGQGVRSALARYDAARASLGLARADISPAVTADAYARRRQDSGNTNFSAGKYEDYRAALNLSWEIDLWGRVRRSINAAGATMEAAGYEYEGVRLSVRGEVARAYLSLRFADVEIGLLESTEKLRSEARDLMQKRFTRGASSRIDYERAVTEHESVLAELADLRAARARYENVLAVLTGQSASGFQIARNGRVPTIPAAPAAVPSELLRRRPDLAAAERRLAVASEQIGLIIANYLPRLSLSGEGGVQALSSSTLFDSSSEIWNIGPEVDIPLFQGGRRTSDIARAEALYREALGIYRGQLLTAIQETEDSLGDSRYLARAASSRRRGSSAAETVARLTRKRYDAGAVDYFEVVDAERTALNEERAELAVNLSRALASTRLIQALGGGWSR